MEHPSFVRTYTAAVQEIAAQPAPPPRHYAASPPPSPLRGGDRLLRPDDTGALRAVRYADFGEESAAIAASRNEGGQLPATTGSIPAHLPGLVEPTREVQMVPTALDVPIIGVPARAENTLVADTPARPSVGRHRLPEQNTPWVRRTLVAGFAIGVMAIPAFVVVDTALQQLGR